VVRLEFEAFITECWLVGCGSSVRVVEGDIVFVRRALSSSHSGHAAMTDWGTSRRLRIDVIEYASGKPRVDETSPGLEQGVVIHSNVLFQGLEACTEHGAPGGL